MLLLIAKRKELLIEKIIAALIQARKEIMSARASGDEKSQKMWLGVADRLLDNYLEEKQKANDEF